MNDLTSLYIQKNEYEEFRTQIHNLIGQLDTTLQSFEGLSLSLGSSYLIDEVSSNEDIADRNREKLMGQKNILENNVLPTIESKIRELIERIRIEEERLVSP